ncbi:OLC1v1008292C1 [Oldenlandia corymbosa var. corymbosa]|uniref:OLC1v1008292C1 n=1 Tax=Oldenlandia corymbosa var. corymbosa TaxID=529605 RepID=A0AAV1DL74_OLDCO|nr:OLC1v1008292C1 [Oldenlandia corymbosa var. corymbosa]
MNQYHIYEAIGRGKYSTVYKGRKKKTIQYFAIKSVDKTQKNKVLQEVRILHSLDHPNVLRFYSWYETSAHLWLVLEYCVGGDLMNLLLQDTKVPEDSVHDMAVGLVTALQFLHSKGIIYCDLKPSNVLLDENGCTKLCDFGLARKLSDISKTPFSQLPQAKRGTPCYMAPELFQDGGVHSFASDLWALGCVLFECYAGRPPFVGKELTQLIQSILSDPTPTLPGSPSRPFVNLINSLLIKDPAERIQWAELCNHAFWKSKFDLLPLPSQPAFMNMIELSSKTCLSERNSDRPYKTPNKFEKDSISKGTIKENESSEIRKPETPVKGAFSTRKTQTKASSKVADDRRKDIPNARGVNLLRLSRIAKTNLQRENEKENYRRPLPNGQDNDAEVEIKNNDMELDFNENPEEEVNDDADVSENVGSSEPNLSAPNQDYGKTDYMDSTRSDSELSPAISTPVSDNLKNSEQEEHVVTPMPPDSSPQPKTARVKDTPMSLDSSDCLKTSTNISEVLWHASDLSVRPVMPSKKSDKGLDAVPFIPFDALSAAEFVKLSNGQLDSMNNRIIGIISGNTAVGEKQSVVKYLEMLSSNADAANILTNGPIMLVLVKVFRQSKTSALRAQLASLMGLLIRHSTFIGDDLANSGILGSLTDGLRDRQEKVRRFSMAALGELLFYISTQNEQQKVGNPPESPSKDNRPSSGWQVTNALISLISSVLRNGEDDMTQLYALRTIENITSQGGYWATRFTSQDVISNLCFIYRAPGKPESMRLTAGSCLVRLARFNPPCIARILEKISFKDIVSVLIKGSPREQQIRLNLLNMAMIEITNIGKYLLSLGEDKSTVPNLVALIEQGSEILRGKALIFVALLCKNGRRWLPQFFCNARLLSNVDRLLKEKDTFVQQCLNVFAHVVASVVPSLLDTVIAEVQQLLGGRRRGQFTPTRNPPKSNIHLFPVILNLLGSSLFKHRVVSSQVLQQFAHLLKLAESPFQGRDEFQITLLKVLECIAEEPPIIEQSSEVFTQQILPSLAVLYKGNKDGDARFLCLKILFDAMVIFLNGTTQNEKRVEDLKSISNSHFLPLYPSLVEDEDPIPMYAQKLLVMLIEYDYIKISDILHTKTVSQCFEFLRGDFSTANVSNVMLCFALASAPELETKILSQLRVVRKIGNLLEFVCAKDMEDFVEPTLNLCRALLLRPVSGSKGFIQGKEVNLLYDNSSEGPIAFNQQECIRDIADFGDNVGVLLELTKSQERNVSDLASECLILLFKTAPREATTGFLTNLPKVSAILDSWNQVFPQHLVQRILHALGYSCRQYLSYSMILSLSIPEIQKIEAIVCDIRKSGAATLADAAYQVAIELQRLPRRI